MYSFINAKIYDYRNYYENAYIVFSEKIEKIGSMTDYKNHNYKEIDLKGKLVIPGFVSGHTHLYSTFARGMSIDFKPQDFLDILKQLWWKLDHFLDKDLIYYSSLLGGLEQLSFGTTSLIDHHASGLVRGSLYTIKKALKNDLNIRSILAFETSDRFDVKECIDENIDFINNNQDSCISGLFGMHASISLSDESLTEISSVLNNRGIHIHVAESLQDEEDCFEKYGMTVVERLEKFNLINERSLLVHCTHINDLEMDIIKKHNATIAVNVTSNLNNAVGISQIKKFLNKGIRVISGNDGLLPNQAIEYLNIFYLSHLKENSPIGFSLDDLKKIITSTYEFINSLLGTELGYIKKNAEADLLVFDYKAYTPINEKNVFGHLFFGVFPGIKPEMVISHGNVIIDNYQFKNDYEDKYISAIQEADRLWKRLEKDGKNYEFKY